MTETPTPNSDTKIVPIGGCGEFGRNMTALISNGKLFFIDAGVMFADRRKLGINGLFNDISPIIEKYGDPAAYIITHGHEDHIGALPYILQKWPALVYIPCWAKSLVEIRMERLGVYHLSGYLRKVSAGETVKIGDVSFEYIRVNHSIPDANAIFIQTKNHKILHSGDFKVDKNSTEQPPIDLKRFKQIGDLGVDLFICDSTNGNKVGIGRGERTTFKPLTKVFKNCKGRIFVTTFSSNLWRIINVIKAARESGRFVCIEGSGIQSCVMIAQEKGIFTPSDGDLITHSDAKHLEDNKVIFLISGSQGEFRSAMQRISLGEHRTLKIKDEDTVVFSSRVIPGNEKEVAFLTSRLRFLGANIVTPSDAPGIHVSGHAFGGEIKIMLDALRPNLFMPVHGTFNQIIDNAKNQGYNFDTIICENADGVCLKGRNWHKFETAKLENLYIDSSGKILTHETTRERLRIGEHGAIFTTGIYDQVNQEFTQGPAVKTFGLVNKKEGIDNMNLKPSIEALFSSILNDKNQPSSSDYLNEQARIFIRRTASNEFGKKPTVVTQIWFENE